MKAATLIGSWFVTGLLVTGLSLMGESQVPSIQARDTLNKGVSAVRNGDYQSAIELFKQAVDLDPSFTTAELYLATAYAQTFLPGVKSSENLARADNAIESFRRVLRQDPNNTMAMLGLAAVYQNTEKLQDAHDTFLTVAKLDPKNPVAFYSIGAIDWLLVFDKKNPLSFGQKSVLIEEGLNDLDTALSLNPRYEDAMTYKNLLLREKAGLAIDPQEKAQLTALADEWFNRALETRKTYGQTGAIAPPPPPPPAQPTLSSGVRARGSIAASNLLRQVPPVYPQAARDSRIQGVVVLEAAVNKDGLVDDLKVINGHPLLTQAAIDAVRQWTYKPMLINGQPVGFVTTITVPFALPQ